MPQFFMIDYDRVKMLEIAEAICELYELNPPNIEDLILEILRQLEEGIIEYHLEQGNVIDCEDFYTMKEILIENS